MPPGALARKISARNSQMLFGRIVSSGDWDAATAVPPATAQDGQFWKATSAGVYGGATIPVGALCLFSENLTVVHFLVQNEGVASGGVQTITGVDGLVVDDTDPSNLILSTTAVLKTSSPLQTYVTNEYGNPSFLSPENVSFSQATSPSKGTVTLDCWASVGRTTKVFVNANVTSWVFNNRPPAGYYYVLDVYIIKDATPKTCVSPATAGKTAGGAWTISGTANSTQRLTLKVTSTDVEMYPFPVLS